MRQIVVRLVVLALVLTPVASWAAGTLHYAGRFYAGGGEFDIAHYADGQDKVAVVGIKTNQQATSVAFAPGEWHSFAELWVKARGIRSATWQFIGSFKETGGDDTAQLSVAAGSRRAADDYRPEGSVRLRAVAARLRRVRRDGTTDGDMARALAARRASPYMMGPWRKTPMKCWA